MVYIDQTSEFQALLGESSRPKSPSGSRSSGLKRNKEKGKEREQEELFLKEAYRIVRVPSTLIPNNDHQEQHNLSSLSRPRGVAS